MRSAAMLVMCLLAGCAVDRVEPHVAASGDERSPTPAPKFLPVIPEPRFDFAAGTGAAIAPSERERYYRHEEIVGQRFGLSSYDALDVLTAVSRSRIVSDGATYERIEMQARVPHSCGQIVLLWIEEGTHRTEVYSTPEACELE